MKYGINYQGSKNAIAKELCSLFPVKENFFDLFAGGCAVTHRMLELGTFDHYYFGDVNPLPLKLFWDCAHGNCPEPRWVSREEFFAKKDTDAYVACCFSFGGDWQTYAYSKEIEPIKEALHYAIVYCDFERADKLGLNVREIENCRTMGQRYAKVKSLLNMNRVEESCNIERLRNLERLSQLSDLSALGVSYDQVEIKPNSVVYCDIPYKSTSKYTCGKFDHEKFYDWCRRQTELTFISEYDMPDDFVCVHEFTRSDSKAAKCTKKVIERLFVPKHQIDMYEENKTTLF